MSFITNDFLLHTSYAKELYHQYAAPQGIIDFHNHLSPKEIAEDYHYSSITELWLDYDHYKWRAMRANGIEEKYITDKTTDAYKRFAAWSKTVPYTLRNPLYHWTHLELKNTFGITDLLNEQSAKRIFELCNEKLAQKAFSAQGLLKQYKVEVVCTTDEPLDSLEYHIKHRESESELLMLPTFRADKLIKVDEPDFKKNLEGLTQLTDIEINSYDTYLLAIRKRADFFDSLGCKLSDIGLDTFYAEEYTTQEIKQLFDELLTASSISEEKVRKLKSAILVDLSRMYHDKGWVQQFHFGCIRNSNTRMFRHIGRDTGFDTIGDWNHAQALAKFLDRLDVDNRLAKTILYNLNPNDNNMIATMAANFNTTAEVGKIQFGSGWWFNDQKLGMTDQMNALSNHGLLSRFIGMLTDSRSILSFSRHEYFRRLLCSLLGEDMQNSELPNDMDLVGNMVSDIAYRNAKQYFDFEQAKVGKIAVSLDTVNA